MTLQHEIDSDYKVAFKASQAPAVSAFRMLKSAIKNKEIDLGHELTDDETREVVAKEVKKRKDAVTQYQSAGRTELAQSEQHDIELFSKYLPAEMSVEELTKIVEAAVQSSGATTPKDMGKVMALVMKQVKGRADGSAVQSVVKKALGA